MHTANSNSEVQEIIISPREIKSVNFFYYRTREMQLVREIILETSKGQVIKVSGKIINQLFRYLDVKYNSLIKIRDWEERNRILFQSLQACQTNLKFSLVQLPSGKLKAIRITSDQFIGLPHTFVLRVVDDVLKSIGIQFKRSVSYWKGMYAQYIITSPHLQNLDLGVAYRIVVYNRNDGNHGLRFYGGLFVLACENGLIRKQTLYKLVVRHVYEPQEVTQKIRDALEHIISDASNRFQEAIEKIKESMEKPLRPEVVRKFIDRLSIPEYIKRYLWATYQHTYSELPHTVWRLSQALSDVGQHLRKNVDEHKLYLQRMAYRVLEEPIIVPSR